MKKSEELANPESCFNKAADDEMMFVILGRDRAACHAVTEWIRERIRIGKNGMDDPQIVEAREWVATVMRQQNPFAVGDLVGPTENYSLRSGSMIYPAAIVTCLDPLIVVSVDGDMMWQAAIKPEYLRRIRPATAAEAFKAFTRFFSEYPVKPDR